MTVPGELLTGVAGRTLKVIDLIESLCEVTQLEEAFKGH